MADRDAKPVRVEFPAWVGAAIAYAVEVGRKHGVGAAVGCVFFGLLIAALWVQRVDQRSDQATFVAEIKAEHAACLAAFKEYRQDAIIALHRNDEANQQNLERLMQSQTRENDRIVKQLERVIDKLDRKNDETELIPFLPRVSPRPKG